MNTISKFLQENTMSHSTIAVDFDGVLHGYSKGWQNGEIYDPPIPGAEDALRSLKSKFKSIVIFTCRMRDDQPLVNGKKQEDLIWEWLTKYNLKEYISSITAIKPYAKFYIDDLGIRFTSWNQAISDVHRNL